MSTSCNPPVDAEPAPEAHPFPYAELSAPGAGESAVAGAAAVNADRPAADPGEQMRRDEAGAKEAGRQEGEAQARAGFDLQLLGIRESVGAAVAEFARQRDIYFQQVESELVRLALEIARKILRREAQVDPLLLAGMVRVVLEKMESGTKVVVRVHPDQASQSRAFFAQHMDPRRVPEVLEDSTLAMDHCVLQTELGTTAMGPEAELKEIEQGLFDLLERRPPSSV
jgi:flagellar assembly protein FliH